MAGAVASYVDRSSQLLQLLNDVVGASKFAGGVTGAFQKDCTDLVRRITLLTHLFEEIRVFKGREFGPSDASTSSTNSSPTESWVSELVVALQAAKRLVLLAANFTSNFAPPPVPANYNDEASKKISFQFQCVTWKLEKALGDVRYDQFDISEEVEEQVELVRAQLRRAIERYGSSMKGRTVSFHSLSQSLVESGNVENNATTIGSIPKSFSADSADGMMIRKSETFRAADTADDIHVDDHDDIKKPDANSSAIPDDFICPISLELMRDPVIVATGQTYERSYIQRWVDCGNTTCPKTQQKLVNLTLTPNYDLRSLIAQWCINNNIEQLNGEIKKSDGSFRNITGDTTMIQALVCKLSSQGRP